MKILHTSDWHLGRALYGRKRYGEFESFLTWLAATIDRDNIDALLVAGDIFDTSTPSNRAQELYYRFLCRVAASACRHVVVIAGNHDSPTFLNAPRELLKALNVHVVGGACADLADEVLVLRDSCDAVELIVCAVPYLRDRDIRLAAAGESVEDKGQKLLDGIRNHYASVAELAVLKREELGAGVPIVAMGHLFTAGGETVDGDGVRELYIGSLARVTAGIFPDCFNYVALGHLHVPQKVGGSETIRYCGSPIPMGFGEAKQKKSICRVEFDGTTPCVDLIDVPVFQQLERVQGDMGSILGRIRALAVTDSRCWLEVIYDGDEIVGDLRDLLADAVAGSELKILRVRNNRIVNRVLEHNYEGEALEDLSENDVFERCLNAHNIPEDQRPELLRTYQEALVSLREEDQRAE